MEHQLDRKKYRQFSIAVFVLCLIFYLGFLFADGPVWCVDSHTYVEMDLSREMLYPLYLAFFRRIFAGSDAMPYGQPVYLLAAAFFASILNAAAAWRISAVTCRYMGKISEKAGILAGSGMAAFQLAVPLINRFLAQRQSMYSECIMTESLAMPLYILFCTELWLGLYENSRAHMVSAFLIAFIQTNLRKQMTVCLLLLLCMSFLVYVWRRNTRNMRRFLLHLAAAVLIIAVSPQLEKVYNQQLHGAAITRTNDNKALYCNLVYTADEEDADLFDRYGTEDDKSLFLELMEIYEEEGVLYINAPRGNIYEMQNHYAQSYDVIGIDIAMPVISAHLHNDDWLENRLLFDETTDRINAVLLHQDLRDTAAVAGRNILEGFADSVAKFSPKLMWYAAGVYILYLILYAVLWGKTRVYPERVCGSYGAILAAEITLGGILINIMTVGVTIFAQPRYMTYGMGMFYGVLLVMCILVFRPACRR